MGSKGQTTTTNQTQTYSPNPVAQGYITDALGRAQSAANQGFNLPVAPVAGFSGQQEQAFNAVGQGYNAAQPYFNQAGNYFQQSAAGPDVSQFFNPYASAVTNNLKDIFGQQMTQTTGNLTQAAGGVGADRIAVGQADLAKQQGLSAGQTLSQLYAPSLQAALQEQNVLQGAGYGTAAVGQGAQNSALQGAQALLGTGGLQQQLAQAQLNAPYQWQVQQSQFPYQQANFYGGLVSALSGGLGGTTTGQGTTTSPGPSIFSQILGAGTAGLGLAGGLGAFNGGWASGLNPFGSSPSWGGGNYWSGDAYGGSASNPLSGLNASDYAARGGVIKGFDEGGIVSDKPIDVDKANLVPSMQLRPMQVHQPQLNLSAPQQSGGGSGGGFGDILKTAASIVPFLKNGGAVANNPYTFFESRFPKGYAEGGEIDEGENFPGGVLSTMHDLRAAQDQKEVSEGKRFFDTGMRIPGRQKARNDAWAQRHGMQKFADGGAPDDVINPDEPYRLAGDEAMNEWRKGVAADAAAGQTAQGSGEPALPAIITSGTNKPTASAAPPTSALAFAGSDRPSAAPGAGASELNPYVIPMSDKAQERMNSFAMSPWAALTQAGLGMMAGTSPFAGVNIGQGGLAGLKMLEQQQGVAQKEETIAQAAKRLEQEAQFHEDQYTRMTPYQKAEVGLQQSRDDLAWEQFKKPYTDLTKIQQETVDRQKQQQEDQKRRLDLEAAKPFKIGVDRSGFDIMGVRDPKNPGRYLDAVTGEPIDPSRVRGAAGQQSSAAEPDGVIPANAAAVAAGAYNYAEGAPAVEKGMDVPEPAAVGAHSARSLQGDAEYYLQTGKLPPGPRGGKSPTAIQQNDYVNAVRNYAGALAQSRGLTPEQTAEMWRTSPGTLRFILGQDGRATVSLGTAVRHLDTLKQLADAWNAGDVQRLNQIRAVISREFGSSAATNLESAAALIGPEIIKALGVAGAGTSDERNHAGSQFSASKSPEQILGAIRTTQSLLGGQLEGKLRQARAAGLSEEKFREMIGERPFEILKRADTGATSGTKALTSQDQQALDWANANPRDPRAAAIKQRLGVQ